MRAFALVVGLLVLGAAGLRADVPGGASDTSDGGELKQLHEGENSTTPARFLPSAWFLLDLETKRLEEGADVGTHVRFWTLRSTVGGAEHVFGPLVGLRSLGVGWSWRFRDGSFMLGAGAVVETEALFDPEKELRVRPAVTLSLRRDGGEE